VNEGTRISHMKNDLAISLTSQSSFICWGLCNLQFRTLVLNPHNTTVGVGGFHENLVCNYLGFTVARSLISLKDAAHKVQFLGTIKKEIHKHIGTKKLSRTVAADGPT